MSIGAEPPQKEGKQQNCQSSDPCDAEDATHGNAIHYSLRLAAAIISDHRKDCRTCTSYQKEPHQQDEHIGKERRIKVGVLFERQIVAYQKNRPKTSTASPIMI